MMCKDGGTKIKLSACSLGIAMGIVSGLYMMLFAWISLMWGYGTPMIQQFASMYMGYSATFVGGLLGGLWGFVDGFIFGIVIGWIYNLCLCCRYKKSSPPDEK